MCELVASAAGGAAALCVVVLLAPALLTRCNYSVASVVALVSVLSSAIICGAGLFPFLVPRIVSAVVAAAAAAFASRQFALFVVAALQVAVCGVAVAGAGCRAVWMLDAASIVVAAGGYRGLAVAEAALLVVLLGADGVSGPRSRHLTWWGVAILAITDVASVVCGRVSRHAIACGQATVALTVVAGTVAMSKLPCDVLVDAFASLGPVAYIAGNYAIHYYPAARGVVSLLLPSPSFPASVSGAVAGICVVCAYVATIEPAVTYGCALPEPAAIAAVGYGAFMAAAVVLFMSA